MFQKNKDDISYFVTHVINHTDKNMSGTKKALKSLISKEMSSNQKYQQLAESLRRFTAHEQPNCKILLGGIIDALEDLQDMKKTLIDRLDYSVKQPLKQYKALTSRVSMDLKQRNSAVSQEEEKLRAFHKIRLISNHRNLTKSQIELAGANQEALHSTITLAEQVEGLVLQKNSDLKAVFKSLFLNQLEYFEQGMGVVKQVIEFIDMVQFEEDVEIVRKKLGVTKNKLN